MNTTVPTNGIASLSFTPQYAPNIAFLVTFSTLLLAQTALAVMFPRFYGYAIGMIGGLILEVVGYAAKLMLSKNPENKNGYIMYVIGLTLGPTFLSSSLYLSIGLLQRTFNTRVLSPIGSKLFVTIFILGDFLCLCYIGVGGSLAAIYADNPIGVDLMIAGLGTQVLFTALFGLMLLILWKGLYSTLRLEGVEFYMIGISLAALSLFVRSCWRVAELSDGFNGPLASKENIFIALDSVPISLMSLLLTLLHPYTLVSKTKPYFPELSEKI